MPSCRTWPKTSARAAPSKKPCKRDRAGESAGFRIDYLEVRDAETLTPLGPMADRPARLLAAVYLGKVRLIDNVPVAAAPEA